MQVPPPIQIPPIQPINILKDGTSIMPSSGLKISENVSSNEMQMDAAKRKTLPAWIRLVYCKNNFKINTSCFS